jgi:hypothetical protein
MTNQTPKNGERRIEYRRPEALQVLLRPGLSYRTDTDLPLFIPHRPTEPKQ